MPSTRRLFNVAGLCLPGEHYMLDPTRGIGGELMNLIDTKQYFVIHAARQTGKTTLLYALTDRLNAAGDYYAVGCSLEAVQSFVEPERGIPAIVKRLRYAFEEHGMPNGFAANADYGDVANVVKKSLTAYCKALDKPLVIFFDEADCLSGETLITFLRQLRDGYLSRGRTPFVHSIALVGMRNLRDYRGKIRKESESMGSSSPFNVVTESLNLRNFTRAEVAQLYAQHTAETGQVFESQAADFAFEQTQGQPWLVNAIARECVEKIAKLDYSITVTQPFVDQAIQNLIKTWGTHFDSMMAKLAEPRVRNIIQPLLLGGGTALDMHSEDYLYTRDLGIIREAGNNVEPANPIYAELIVRTLTWNVQVSLLRDYEEYEIPRYLRNGKIDMDILMGDFQLYWRENSEIWVDRYKTQLYRYDEAAAHLVMQAFLQRVINGGGHIIREMALGKMRADICVIYKENKYPIELKILQNQRSLAESLKQTAAYMDRLGTAEGWLVLFDKDTEKSWDEKIYSRKESVGNKVITVVGC
ncbi:MAG: ATP-binding protein [Chitinispirillales bacterium]|jgi:hypothetical protein|nr:ATP-binding protein [Chitinispirillales bacterium]